MSRPGTDPHSGAAAAPPRLLILLLAAGCGIAVANLYFVPPLLEVIAADFGVGVAGVVPAAVATQLGYASGLLLVSPLGDRVSRRTLVIRQALGLSVALASAALAPTPVMLALSCFAIGVAATFAQQLVPLAAQVAPDAVRGRVVGTVMSGLLLGILGGRVFAGLLGDLLGWRAPFAAAALLVAAAAALFAWRLPGTAPTSHERWPRLIASIVGVARAEPVLREAALTSGLTFGAFSVFWVALTPWLASDAFGLDSRVAGAFGVVGMAGALIAPVAGRASDRVGGRRVLLAAIATVIAGFVVLLLAGRSLAGLAAGVLLLDLGVQAGLIANQSRILSLAPQMRSRVNAFFMTAYFAGGATGSLLAGIAWTQGGWPAAMSVGLALAVAAALALARGHRRPGGSAA